VRLRPPREDDAHAIAQGCSDQEVARWTKVPSPYTLDDARAWIASAQLQLEGGTELQLVLVRAAEDRPAGGVALRQRPEPELHGDIGYWVAATARAQGLASAGVRLLAAHALGPLGLPFVEIALSPRNDASRGVARAAGFERHTVELREFKGALEEFEVWRRRCPR
jgi:RimJ/RimL family protein N-acetyltransferase